MLTCHLFKIFSDLRPFSIKHPTTSGKVTCNVISNPHMSFGHPFSFVRPGLKIHNLALAPGSLLGSHDLDFPFCCELSCSACVVNGSWGGPEAPLDPPLGIPGALLSNLVGPPVSWWGWWRLLGFAGGGAGGTATSPLGVPDGGLTLSLWVLPPPPQQPSLLSDVPAHEVPFFPQDFPGFLLLSQCHCGVQPIHLFHLVVLYLHLLCHNLVSIGFLLYIVTFHSCCCLSVYGSGLWLDVGRWVVSRIIGGVEEFGGFVGVVGGGVWGWGMVWGSDMVCSGFCCEICNLGGIVCLGGVVCWGVFIIIILGWVVGWVGCRCWGCNLLLRWGFSNFNSLGVLGGLGWVGLILVMCPSLHGGSSLVQWSPGLESPPVVPLGNFVPPLPLESLGFLHYATHSCCLVYIQLNSAVFYADPFCYLPLEWLGKSFVDLHSPFWVISVVCGAPSCV